jgi:alpha-tubulin suppressor-like RCC1 family protein
MMPSSSSWSWQSRERRVALALWASLLVVPLLAVLGAALLAPPVHAEQAGSTAGRVAAGSLDAGGAHTCAVLTTGAVRCWGDGGSGQLGHDVNTTIGDGTHASIRSAGDLPLGPGVKVVAVAAGDNDSCALLTTGAVRCWGSGASGRLGHDSTSNVGDGTGPSIQAAGDVPLGLGAKAVAITAGHAHTCALLTTGDVRCWGDGFQGQLGHDSRLNIGDGAPGDPSIEVAGNVPLAGRATAITAGDSYTCALMATGAVRCWGYGASGQLGYDGTTNVGDGDPAGVPIEALPDVPLSAKVTAISAGTHHTCALTTTGRVRCWGDGGFGQLGYGSKANIGDGGGVRMQDLADVPLGGTAVAISAGGNHTCALLTTGHVRCWGQGVGGELGHGNTSNIGDGVGPSIKDAGDVPLGAKAVAISAGTEHTCALLTTGHLRCWGNGLLGRLGHDNATNVGDGFSGVTVKQAGDVPVGASVEVRAATTLTARATPKRDRRSPYVYVITGRVSGRFVAGPTSCSGRVKVTVRHGAHTLQVRKPRLDTHCGYRGHIRLRGSRLHVHRATRLKVRVRYLGTGNLQPVQVSRRLTAH